MLSDLHHTDIFKFTISLVIKLNRFICAVTDGSNNAISNNGIRFCNTNQRELRSSDCGQTSVAFPCHNFFDPLVHEVFQWELHCLTNTARAIFELHYPDIYDRRDK